MESGGGLLRCGCFAKVYRSRRRIAFLFARWYQITHSLRSPTSIAETSYSERAVSFAATSGRRSRRMTMPSLHMIENRFGEPFCRVLRVFRGTAGGSGGTCGTCEG